VDEKTSGGYATQAVQPMLIISLTVLISNSIEWPITLSLCEL